MTVHIYILQCRVRMFAVQVVTIVEFGMNVSFDIFFSGLVGEIEYVLD